MRRLKLFIVVIGIVFLLAGCCSNQILLELNWDIRLPWNAQELYHVDTGPSFHGDGKKYTVFTSEYPEKIEWSEEQGPTEYTSDYGEFMEGIYQELSVPEDEKADLTQCVYFYFLREDGSQLLLLYNEDEKLLYGVEAAM